MTLRLTSITLLILTALEPRLALAQAAQPQPAAAALNIAGDIASPVQLSLADLAKMPRATATVHEMDGSSNRYEGVALRDVLTRAGAPLGKDFRGKAVSTCVLAKARDGYAAVFTLGEVDPDFGNEQIIVADKRNGEPLPENQGPFRIVCPNDKHGARSVRMLETLEVMRLRK